MMTPMRYVVLVLGVIVRILSYFSVSALTLQTSLDNYTFHYQFLQRKIWACDFLLKVEATNSRASQVTLL